MPERDQILLSTFARALSLVDEALKANDTANKLSYQMLLWKSAAEAEYLAFQISMIHGLSDYPPNSADDPETSVDAASTLLQEAQSSIELDPRSAYGAVRRAVTILRKAYATGESTPKRQSAPTPTNE